MLKSENGSISGFFLGIFGLIVLVFFVGAIIVLFLGGMPTIQYIFQTILHFFKQA